MKDPNLRVQEAIALIFQTFRQTWSARQTFKWFHDQGIELPVNRARDGRIELVFQLPTLSFIGDVLHNPIYAGAYVYGRRPVEVRLVDGRPRRRQGRLRPLTEARVFIADHHEGYIDWAMYEEHQQRLRGNSLRQEGDEGARAAPTARRPRSGSPSPVGERVTGLRSARRTPSARDTREVSR